MKCPYRANIIREMDGKGRVDLSSLDSLRDDLDGERNAGKLSYCRCDKPAALMAML